MRGVYLCAKEHRINGYDIIYNDIENYVGIDLCCSCEDVDVSIFDYIIATPPCNYWSIANYRRDVSNVALSTKNLLPYCLKLCIDSGKPFIVENVCNEPLFKKELGSLYDSCMCFQFGHHTFWTNIFFFVPYKEEEKYKVSNKKYLSYGKRDNNYNVDLVLRRFLEVINNGKS